jgi:drug/metabolite transporter (DMT)-like permease
MVAVVLGLAAGCCFGWADFLGGLASRRLGARAVVLGGQALSLVVLAVPLALTGPSIHGDALIFGGLAGVAGTVGLLALFRAMELGAMGTASPIAALGAAVPVVAGLAAGERPAVAGLIGIPLALAGAALVCHSTSTRRGIRHAFVAAAGVGGFFGLMSHAAACGAGWSIVAARAAALPIAYIAAGGFTQLRRARAGDLALVAAMAATEIAADTAFVLAATRGDVSVASVLATLSPVTTVALAWAIAREPVTQYQGVGIGVALTGAVFLTGAA